MTRSRLWTTRFQFSMTRGGDCLCKDSLGREESLVLKGISLGVGSHAVSCTRSRAVEFFIT